MCHLVFTEVTSGNGTKELLNERSWVPINANTQGVRAFSEQRFKDLGLNTDNNISMSY